MNVDVIIPVHNLDIYLSEALDSVLFQRGVSPRVFVVDDGSAAPISLLPRFVGDSRVTLTRSDANLGIGGARNLGVSLGSSPWLAFLDSDDRWAPNHCETLLSLMDAPLTYAVGSVRHFADPLTDTPFFVPATEIVGACPGSTLLSRNNFEAIGGFRTYLKSGEFIDLVSRGRAAGWIERQTSTVVLERRVHKFHASRLDVANDEGLLRSVRDHLKRSQDERNV